ncbi:hypothetical protein IW261DRAFT_1461819 [Armillaria novae-zelandiae]|uniref:Uncharacterized protein n=1 Tax=Armillaria novae-zelandiae TaxID=153914 RepID=A0AA39UBH8_9AGAR|nr:hypothetical protein IW261DRAFT_1461819 [Armillaria novae-zelandiae]
MNCAAYFPKTSRLQACTCSASLIEHTPAVNGYRSPPLPYETGIHPSSANTFTGDMANIPFTPVPLTDPSANDGLSYSVNVYSPGTLPYEVDDLPSSSVNTFTDTATQVHIPSPSYSYDNIMITPTVPDTATTQIDAHSHLEVENSYIVQ